MSTLKNTKTPGQNQVQYKCATCSHSTAIIGNFNQHLKTHSSEKSFKCSQCLFAAKQKSNLQVHVNNVHVLNSTSSSFRPFPCSQIGCNYAAKDKRSLNAHLKTHSDKTTVFFCSHPDCNFSTKYKASLSLHTRIHTGEKPFVCQFESCSYSTTSSGDLVSHSRIHTKEKPFKCPQPNCQFLTAHKSSLAKHQLTHPPKEGEERPSFSCILCEYSSKIKGHLFAHIKTHTLEKFFKCDKPNCSFESKTKGVLKLHKLVHSEEKPFACPVESCDYRCKMNASLSIHLKTHTDERQYKCELCPFRGKTRNVVRGHMRSLHIDIDTRPFKCTEPKCEYATKSKRNLHRHVLLHKGEKKYSCAFPACEYKSVLKINVKRHEKAVHET